MGYDRNEFNERTPAVRGDGQPPLERPIDDKAELKRWWDYTNDPVNRAISAANSCLYGICHAAIVSSGYSTAIGFIHTGKMLSFVYDIADLYKVDLAIPMAFRVAAQGSHDIESRIRKECRDVFHRHRLLQRIVPDIHFALGVSGRREERPALVDLDPGLPGGIWDPFEGELEGGVNRSEESSWEESS